MRSADAVRGAGPLAEGSPGPDLRLVPAAAASWAASGWAVARDPAVCLAVAGGAAGLAVLLLVVVRFLRGSDRSPAGLGSLVAALACAALVLVSAAGHLGVRSAGLLTQLVDDGATVAVEGVVLGDPRPVRPGPDARPWQGQDRVVVRVRVEQVEGRGRRGPARAPVLVLAEEGWDAVVLGERLVATGRLAPSEPGDDVVALLVASGPPRSRADAPDWQQRAESLRAGLRTAAQPLSADAGGLLPGLVVGDTSELPPDLQEDMRRVGLTHLTAVSGANVAIVCGTVLLVAAACGVGRRLRLATAGIALVAFVVLARPDPSVLRAAVMGSIGLVGLAAARRGRGVPLLCAAVVLLTTVNPWLSRSYAFALSTLATGALLLLARPMAEALGRVVPTVVAQAVAVPAAAQAVCGPVVVLLAPEVPLLAVPANLLVAPAVAPATVLGVVATALAAVWMPATQAVAWLAGLATAWIAWVARTSATVPGATVPWPGGVPGAVLLASLTVLGLVLGGRLLATAGRRTGRRPAGRHRLERVPRGVSTAQGVSAAHDRSAARWRPPVAVVAAAAMAVLVVVTAAFRWAAPTTAWLPPGWRVVACDVGQGDALVVASGSRSAVVLDVGPDPTAVDRCLRELQVQRIDLLVLSHFHADHVGGLDGLLSGRAVGEALVSPLRSPRAQADRTLATLRQHGVPVREGWAGQRGRAGAVDWHLVWPSRLLGSAEDGSDANDASVVVVLEVDELRVLATGDVEPPAQAALRRELAAVGFPPVDVLKVAHHGSAAQDEGFNRLVAPRVALVSAGDDNSYGHPAPAALELMERAGATSLRTDLHGHVAVGGAGEGLWVATQRQSDDRGRLWPWQDGGERQAA